MPGMVIRRVAVRECDNCAAEGAQRHRHSIIGDDNKTLRSFRFDACEGCMSTMTLEQWSEIAKRAPNAQKPPRMNRKVVSEDVVKKAAKRSRRKVG